MVRFPPPDPGFASRFGRSGIVFIFLKVNLNPRALTTFWYKLGHGKKNLYPWLSLQQIQIRFWLLNATRWCDGTSEPKTLEALLNAFTLIYRCEIYPNYEQILFTWTIKCSRGCCFYVIIFFGIFLLFS